jgi:hypothetical protein
MHANWAAHDYTIPETDNPAASASAVVYRPVGVITYSDGQQGEVVSGSYSGVAGHLAVRSAQDVPSMFVSSSRAPFFYESVALGGLPSSDSITPAFALQEAIESQQRVNRAGQNDKQSSLAGSMKRTLFTWMVGAYGVKSGERYLLQPDDNFRSRFEGFELALRRAIPEQFQFSNIEIEIGGEVVFVCRSGNERFLIEGGSGGFTSLIETIWMLYLMELNVPDDEQYTAIIDEIENHLHPSVQRTVLPNLVAAFPRARFVVSTHSPLVVSSVPDAVVYALRHDEQNQITAEILDFKDKARTAAQILDEVLGVSVTLPVWAENRLKVIINNYARRPVTPTIFDELRADLQKEGLETLVPDAITGVLVKNG